MSSAFADTAILFPLGVTRPNESTRPSKYSLLKELQRAFKKDVVQLFGKYARSLSETNSKLAKASERFLTKTDILLRDAEDFLRNYKIRELLPTPNWFQATNETCARKETAAAPVPEQVASTAATAAADAPSAKSGGGFVATETTGAIAEFIALKEADELPCAPMIGVSNPPMPLGRNRRKKWGLNL